METITSLFFSKVGLGIGSVTSQVKLFQYELFLGVCTCFCMYIIGNIVKKKGKNLPPGPAGLPIVGYLPFLSDNIHLDFIKLGKTYGDVFRLRLGSQNVVVVQDAKIVRESLNKPEVLGKPPNSALEFAFANSAFLTQDVHLWKEQRRFVVHSLKDLGLGGTKIEHYILDEINHFLEVLKSHNGQPIDIKVPLSPSISNNISALMFGKRYEYEDPDRKSLDDNLDDVHETLSQNSLDSFIPWLRYLPFFNKFLKTQELLDSMDKIRKFIRKELVIHLESLDPRNIRDFMDSYLLEIKSQKVKNSNTSFSEDMLIGNITDLFSAGSETVRTSTIWFIYTMAAYPEVQKKIQDEILEVLGSDQSPEYLDIKRMPYTHAAIMETLRWKSIDPLNLPRYTLADTKIGGYDVPKDTVVIANFWHVHHDPRYWTEPESFMPERFLSEDGKTVVKSNNLMPFSIGRRACPGETMAYMELFLYYTSILQKFDIVFPTGVKPTFEAKQALTYRLEPFLVRFVPKY